MRWRLMKNIGRNDPCPCGSGKKYKKCHGASNVIEISPERYNAELERLHIGLLEFATHNYSYFIEKELDEILEEYKELQVADDEIAEFFSSILRAWIILHAPIQNGKTIFDLYYMEQKWKISNERIRRTFASWSGTVPSIYEVLSNTEDEIEIKDLRSQETYKLMGAGDEERDFLEGSYLMGFLLPYIQLYDFFMAIPEFTDTTPEALEMIQTWSEEEIINNYPDILAAFIEFETVTGEFEWDYPPYEMVAELFTRHMEQKKAPQIVISTGIVLWKYFTELEQPMFTKIGSYAGALEYVIQREILGIELDSQKGLAEEYGISVTTLSKNAMKLKELLEEQIAEAAENIKVDLPHELDDLLDPEIMESFMDEVESLLEEQEFESEEEAEAFVDQLLESVGLFDPILESPRDLAEEKLAEAIQTSGKARKKLIDEALAIDPDFSDAYLMKAEDTSSTNEKYQLYSYALSLAEKELDKEYFHEGKGHFWGITETRPFMRAKAGLATFLDEYGDKTKARAHYEQLLELNPNDNQGIRYYLLRLYLELGDYESASKLVTEYKDDASIEFAFNNVLLHYFRDGITAKTKKLLKQAMKQNPFVKYFLTGQTKLRTKRDKVANIQDMEANAYVLDNIALWQQAGELIEAIKKM